MYAHGRAFGFRGVVFILAVLAFGSCFSPAWAFTPARYKATPIGASSGFEITINAPEHIIDLMDPANAAQVCDPGTIITQSADIDMSGITLLNGIADPTPGANGSPIAGTQIGTTSLPFQGTFDGQGFSIEGLTLAGDGNPIDAGTGIADTADGLFGVIAGGAVSNVMLTNVQTIGSATAVGALAGHLNGGMISRCCISTAGSNILAIGTANQSIGGLVGRIDSDAIVQQCFSMSRVIGPDDVGGLVGYVESAAVQDCYFCQGLVLRAGTFSGAQPSADLGGIVGQCQLGTISGCWSRCSAPIVALPSAASDTFIGGIVGAWTAPSTLIVFRQNFSCDADAGTAVGAGLPSGLAAAAVSAARMEVRATYDGGGWVLPDGIWYWLGDGCDCPRFWWQ